MTHKGIQITGAAASGVGTCLVLQPYKLVLDMGHVTPEARNCRDVLISHPHIDHMAGCASHAAYRDMLGMEPTRFICHPEVAERLETLLNAWRQVQGGFRCTIIPLAEGQEVQVGQGTVVRPTPTYHRTPSTGFVVVERRTKLKPEFQGRPGDEIGQLRKSGVTVTDQIETPMVVYTGDTTPEALEHDLVRQAQVVITECTFMGDEHTVAFARERGHTHLKDLAPRLEALACERIVLGHFSLRYSRQEIEAAMATLSEAVRCKLELLLDGDGTILGW